MLHSLNGKLNNFILGHFVTGLFFELFFQIVVSFRLLHPRGHSPVPEVVSRRVHFENLGSSFQVNGAKNGLHRIGSHEGLLGVNLGQIAHSLG